MTQLIFPPMVLKDWKETRDTLQKYCRMAGAIREALSPPLPHSFHTNLLVISIGFTTSSLSKNFYPADQMFEVAIDIVHQRLIIESNFREPFRIALTGQSLNALCDETCSLLTDLGVKPPLEKPSFLDGTRGRFDPEPLIAYWNAVSAVNRVMNEIKTEIKGESSPVYLRPDDFMVVLTWYGESPKKSEDKVVQPVDSVESNRSCEQVDLGFSTGDGKFPEAYFYITAFPDYRKLKKIIPDENFAWFSEEYPGMILPYAEVIAANNPLQVLLDFYRSVLPVLVKPVN